MRFILLITLILAQNISHSALRVSIDPGHGGSEAGAVHGQAKESDLTLKVSQKLYNRLKNDKQFQVQLLRSNDQDLDLEQRVAMAKKFGADLFISIHANANPNPRAQGAEFYIQNQLPVDQEALFLAHAEHEPKEDSQKPKGDVESIVQDLKKSQRILESYQVSGYIRQHWAPQKRRMIRQGPFYVLSQNEVPAVLVEIGYLTNARERSQLLKESYQSQLAKKIHFALKDYAKNSDKLPPDVLQRRHAKTR